MKSNDTEQKPKFDLDSQKKNETHVPNAKSHLGIETQLFNATRNNHFSHETHTKIVKFRDLNNEIMAKAEHYKQATAFISWIAAAVFIIVFSL